MKCDWFSEPIRHIPREDVSFYVGKNKRQMEA